MSKTLEPVSGVGRVAFELDRFELANGDYYELQGRWFGVRGRRFIRPTLTLLGEDQSRRLLADLAHKPWAAEDGQPWQAAFPRGAGKGEVQEAELAVAPDILVTLPAPGGEVSPRRRKRPASRSTQEVRSKPAERPAVPDRSDALTRELTQTREAQRRLERQVERAETDRTEAAARLDELLGNLSQAIRERDEAQSALQEAIAERDALAQERAETRSNLAAARRERDEVTAERDAAAAARDDALQEIQVAVVDREAAAAEREQALVAGGQAQSERDAALTHRDWALDERDAALQTRDQALHERDAALAAGNSAARELEVARQITDNLKSQLAHQSSSLGAALVMRRAVQTPPAFRRQSGLAPRVLAIIGLMAAVVLLLIVLRVV